MKKTLIATAIAGAMSFTAVAQAAEVNYDLYGSLRVQALSEDGQSLNIQDNASRVGIKASTELAGGITGIARLEFKAKTDSGDVGEGRLAYIGATGDFGTVTAGRQWTPQYLWTSAKVDIMDGPGSAPTHSYGLAGRKGNTLAYITPDMGGLQVAAVVIAAGGADNDPATGDEFDAYNLAAHFTAGGLSIGAATILAQNNIDKSYNAVAASYTMGDLYVATVVTDDNISKEDSFEVAGSYTMGDFKLLGNYVDFEEGELVSAEVQYKLGAQSRVAATVVSADDDAPKADSLSVSWRVDF